MCLQLPPIFTATNNGDANGNKHRVLCQGQMGRKAGQSVPTALIGCNRVIAVALDPIELLAQVCIDQTQGLC